MSTIIVHGGAGDIPASEHGAHLNGCERAVMAAMMSGPGWHLPRGGRDGRPLDGGRSPRSTPGGALSS